LFKNKHTIRGSDLFVYGRKLNYDPPVCHAPLDEKQCSGKCIPRAVVFKRWPAGHMWPARPSGVAREAIFIGKKT